MHQPIEGRRRRTALAAHGAEGAPTTPHGRARSACAALFAVGVIGLVVMIPSVAHAAGAPAIAFDPPSHDYKAIDSGTTASQEFTLKNSGGTATRALTVSLPDPSAFSKTADTCTGTSLGPNKSCSVTVQYAPTTVGASDNATLKASSKKPTAAATASLTGAGARAAPPSESQLDCEAFKGTFAAGPAPALWTCTEWYALENFDLIDDAKYAAISDDCDADGGSPEFVGGEHYGTLTTTCYPKSQAQVDCETFGGEFIGGDPGGSTVWRCNGWSAPTLDQFTERSSKLKADCPANFYNLPYAPAAFPATVSSHCFND